MSRVGLKPIPLSDSVKFSIDGLDVRVKGDKGELQKKFSGDISISVDAGNVRVIPLKKDKKTRAMWGTTRSIINNMVHGVVHGFHEKLQLVGVGYKFSIQGQYINFSLAKSHGTKLQIPSHITASADKGNILVLSSLDKELLGQFVSKVISQRPSEPYKGRGIRKVGQYVRTKETKKG